MSSHGRCPRCGTPADPGARFCGGCGASLVVSSPEAVAATLVSSGRPEATPEDPMVGRVLDERYQVGRKIGAGGFGAVYEGVQLNMGRAVALKILHPHMTRDPKLVARFEREARSACNLRDAHTIITYDFHRTDDGILYLVMELLKGRSLLQEVLSLGALPHGRTVFLVDQVCSALAEAHAHGIVHRDIKPENIFIEDRESQRDYVKVLDFGIAKIMAGEPGATANLTASGQTLGTLEYMSPEQLAGSDLDGRSDIYSLGVMMYQMLTGGLPFSGTPTAIITAHLNRQPAPPSSSNSRVPAALDRVVLRCMAKERDQRYPDMAALRAELSAVELGRAASLPFAAVAPAVEPALPGARIAAGAAAPVPGTRLAAPPATAAAAPLRAAPIRAARPVRRGSGAGLVIAIILIVLGVVGGIIAGTYFYLTSDGPGEGSSSGERGKGTAGGSAAVSWQVPFAGSAGAAAAASATALEKLVPSDAALMIAAAPKRLLTQLGVQDPWTGVPPQAREVMRTLGIRPDSMEELLLLAPRIPEAGSAPPVVFGARGIDGSTLWGHFERQGARRQSHRGVALLVQPDAALARLDDGTVLIGHLEALRSALDARAGGGGLGGTARELNAAVRREGTLAFGFFRPDARMNASLRQELELDAGAGLQGIAAGLSESGKRWRLDLVAQASSPAVAVALQRKGQELLQQLRAQPRAVQLGLAELVEKVSLQQQASRVVLALEVEGSALDSLRTRLERAVSAGAPGISGPAEAVPPLWQPPQAAPRPTAAPNRPRR